MDNFRRLLPAVAAAVLAGSLLAPATASPAPPAPPPAPATGVVGPCQVVATSREGRAWLPAVELVVPGGRVDDARVVVGAARVEVTDGRLHVQRTSRRSPAASGPVELALALAGPEGTTVHMCTVDPGDAHVDPTTRLRRVVRAG